MKGSPEPRACPAAWAWGSSPPSHSLCPWGKLSTCCGFIPVCNLGEDTDVSGAIICPPRGDQDVDVSGAIIPSIACTKTTPEGLGPSLGWAATDAHIVHKRTGEMVRQGCSQGAGPCIRLWLHTADLQDTTLPL